MGSPLTFLVTKSNPTVITAACNPAIPAFLPILSASSFVLNAFQSSRGSTPFSCVFNCNFFASSFVRLPDFVGTLSVPPIYASTDLLGKAFFISAT